ncbi:MAG: phosphatase PAP2 family protein [Micavibrio sp.]
MKIQIYSVLVAWVRLWGRTLRQTLTSRFFLTYLVIVGLFGVAVRIMTHQYGAGFSLTMAAYSQPLGVTTILSLCCFLFVRLLVILVIERPRRPIGFIYREFKDRWFAPQRIVQGLAVMIFIPVFFSFFTSAKNMIPAINPFSWDPFFAEAERIIHFGRQPWEWLHPLLGAAIVTSWVSFTYKTWFFSKYMVILWQAFTLSHPNLRAQFFITMCLAWIVNGTILAMIFSSAGPCYFDYFYPDLANPYEGLMNYLRESDKIHRVYDLFAMDYLLNQYHEKKSAFFSGISAFPSMHVSVAFLNVLLGWRINKVLGVCFTAYLLAIMIGSVHMGWHYAVDGYISIIITWILWLIVGRFFPKDKIESEVKND